MAAAGGAKKKDESKPNMVQLNEMFADRVRHEQQAAQEWEDKWGIDPEREKKKQELLQRVIPASMHDYLEQSKQEYMIIQTPLGTKKEAIDRTLAKTLFPSTVHLVGEKISVDGVDPTKKYKFPITTSQEVGWYAQNFKNIEIPILEGRKVKPKKPLHY